MKQSTKDDLKWYLGLGTYIAILSFMVPYSLMKYAQHAEKTGQEIKAVFPPKIETYAAQYYYDRHQKCH